MRKLMVEFFREFKNRGIKIARITSILITLDLTLYIDSYQGNQSIYLNFIRCLVSVVILTFLN